MRLYFFVIVFCLSACSVSDRQGISHLELAKFFLFDCNDRNAGQKHLELAIVEENSIEARTLLARILLKDNFAERRKALPLVTPYIEKNANAALIYGLIHYPNEKDNEASFYGFYNAAQLGHPTGMLYTAAYFHHVLRQDNQAIKWAMKALEQGCATANSYLLLKQSRMEDIQEEMDQQHSYLANFNNAFSQIIMMGKARLLEQDDEFYYWKRRAINTRKMHEHQKSLSLYDLNIECQNTFNHDLFNKYLTPETQ